MVRLIGVAPRRVINDADGLIPSPAENRRQSRFSRTP
jgi:hypothetical protein